MTAAEQKIHRIVAGIRARWIVAYLLRWTSLCAAALMLWLLAAIVLDNVLMLDAGQLRLTWIPAAVLAIFTLMLPIWRLTRGGLSDDQLARLFESRVLNQRNRLINAVQFLRTPLTQNNALTLAVVLENAEALHETDTATAIDPWPTRRALIALSAVLLIVLAYTTLRPEAVRNGLTRLLNPTHPPPHFLSTDITVTPGDADVIEGQPLAVNVTLGRNIPAQAHIEYRIGELEWTRAEMTREGNAKYRFDGFKAVWHPMQYRIAAGRSVSPTHQVTLSYYPRVESLQVRITRPPYADGRQIELKPNVGDIIALAGSNVAIEVVSTRPIRAGGLAFSDDSFASLEVDEQNPHRGRAKFVIASPGTYAIRVIDDEGLANVNPPRYSIAVEPDQPPVAVIALPGRDLILPLNTVVDLTIEAQDDVGLASVALQVQYGGSDWSNHRQWDVPQIAVRRRVFAATLPLAEMGLKIGDVLLYRATATDRRPDKPNLGVGRTWSITITEASDDPALLADQTQRLLEALNRILELQKENRQAVDLDRDVEPIRGKQERIRQLMLEAIDAHRKVLRPSPTVVRELVDIADGPMVQAQTLLKFLSGNYEERIVRKPPVLGAMDRIIARLEALIGRVNRARQTAETAQQTLEQLPPQEKDKALADIRNILDKLRKFIPEQDKVIADTEELVRKGENLTDADLQKIERLKGTQDKWAELFTDSVKDIAKLTEQGFADRTIANDYKEMVEQIEAASLNLNPKLIEMAVPREQSGRELAESLAEDMEMWLPNSPDHIKWMMEEPLDFPPIPMVDLPDQLYDLIGDLIEEQDALNDMAEDVTSAWADSISAAGWQVDDGPISNFSAVGKTGNRLPDDHELSGRAGEGRSGRSQGQLVEDVAKGLTGRRTPARVTNDPYEQGVVKELQQMATGGATGGGKARGSGQEGLQGHSPPSLFKDMQTMSDWQQRIRGQAEQVAGQLKTVRMTAPDLERAIELMRDAEQAAKDGRYADMFKRQQMVAQRLRMAGDLAVRDVSMRIDRAYHLPADQRRQVLDAMDEPVPSEYQDAVRRYFLKLSENPR